MKIVQDALDRADILLGHNIKFDLQWLFASGFKYDGAVYDTKLLIYDFYNGVTYEEDLIYQPDIPLLCKSGDKIEVEIITDGSAGKTVSTRVIARLV